MHQQHGSVHVAVSFTLSMVCRHGLLLIVVLLVLVFASRVVSLFWFVLSSVLSGVFSLVCFPSVLFFCLFLFAFVSLSLLVCPLLAWSCCAQ